MPREQTNQTESAVFKLFGCCISRGSLFRLFKDYNSCRCVVAALKTAPYIDIMLLFLHFMVLWDCRIQYFYLGTKLRSTWGKVASAIIFHEQTRSNPGCSFQTLDAVFPKDIFSDCLMAT